MASDAMNSLVGQADPACSFCAALGENERGPNRLLNENTVLLQTDRFVVLPAIGPFAAGHVLAVSRAHHVSLGAMGSDAIEEYNHLIERICQMDLYARSQLLEAEHGATYRECGAACVAHTHVHLLPGFGQFSSIFDGVYALLPADLASLADLHNPYVLLRGSDAKVRLFDATGFPSQLVRKAICARQRRTDWDWRQSSRPDWTQQTIEYWKANA
jgi:diadenosine tetraphosphate (Ap4A) HIT family hydrolase